MIGRRLSSMEKGGQMINVSDLDNPLEKFYVQKTAQLHHNFLLKKLAAEEGQIKKAGLSTEDELHLYCKEFGRNTSDTEEDVEEEEGEDESGCGCKDHHDDHQDEQSVIDQSASASVFTVSEGLEQFISRSISLDIEDYHISNVVISL
jgi:hypothetical protein